ncbi:unnamed protein product, partial [Mesorhabditis spiculigera]
MTGKEASSSSAPRKSKELAKGRIRKFVAYLDGRRGKTAYLPGTIAEWNLQRFAARKRAYERRRMLICKRLGVKRQTELPYYKNRVIAKDRVRQIIKQNETIGEMSDFQRGYESFTASSGNRYPELVSKTSHEISYKVRLDKLDAQLDEMERYLRELPDKIYRDVGACLRDFVDRSIVKSEVTDVGDERKPLEFSPIRRAPGFLHGITLRTESRANAECESLAPTCTKQVAPYNSLAAQSENQRRSTLERRASRLMPKPSSPSVSDYASAGDVIDPEIMVSHCLLPRITFFSSPPPSGTWLSNMVEDFAASQNYLD